MPSNVTPRLFKHNALTGGPYLDWSIAARLNYPLVPFEPTVCNRSLQYYWVNQWMADNLIASRGELYHMPLPVGFVARWMERAQEAEKRVQELETQLLECRQLKGANP